MFAKNGMALPKAQLKFLVTLPHLHQPSPPLINDRSQRVPLRPEMQLKHKDKQEGLLGIFRFGALSQIAEIAKLSENIRRNHD